MLDACARSRSSSRGSVKVSSSTRIILSDRPSLEEPLELSFFKRDCYWIFHPLLSSIPKEALDRTWNPQRLIRAGFPVIRIPFNDVLWLNTRHTSFPYPSNTQSPAPPSYSEPNETRLTFPVLQNRPNEIKLHEPSGSISERVVTDIIGQYAQAKRDLISLESKLRAASYLPTDNSSEIPMSDWQTAGVTTLELRRLQEAYDR